MKQVTIGNKTLPYNDAIEKEEYYNGASRRTITFECEPDVIGLDEINNLLSVESNLATIKCENIETGQQTITNFYDNYVLKLQAGIEKRLISSETPDRPAVYGDKLIFKIGMRTYTEHQLKKLGL